MSSIVASKSAGIDRIGEMAVTTITPSVGGLIFWFDVSGDKCKTDDDRSRAVSLQTASNVSNFNQT